jgi:predicted Fe-Mo cluster-binding NifX family protein
MKICVSSTTNNLDGQIDPRFGRCNYLLIIDSQTMHYESIPNMACSATGGAGIQTVQTIADKGVKVVITGNVGPNALKALSTSGVEVITGAFGTIKEVIEKFNRGELSRTRYSPTEEHFNNKN